ncbi:hypothetical protein EB001_15535 [bacterium]|jgi:hypothetical protein|nr:hypothetical protein [bacterium]
MSVLLVDNISSQDVTNNLTLYTGNNSGPYIVLQSGNSVITMAGDIQANSISGNAAGTLLLNMITYSLAF